MTTLLIRLIRFYLGTLARVAPRTAGRQAYRLFSRPRWRRPAPEATVTVMARARRTEVAVREHRVAVYTWSRPAAGGAAPRVLLVHGWESRAARLAAWVDPLLEAGFEVVAFDAPAHGLSTGRRADPLLFVESMQAAVAHVGPVTACVGHSLGGYASLLATSGGELLEAPELAVERLVLVAGAESGVDAMSMFCEVLGLGEGFLPLLLAGAAEAAGRPIPDFDAHRTFARRPIPTLWFHDPEDTEVPFRAAERVRNACPHVRLETIEGLGHHRIARDPEVIRRAVAFLGEQTWESARPAEVRLGA